MGAFFGRDLTSRRLIILKGLLFVLLGAMATGGVIAMALDPAPGAAATITALHLTAVWAFCRAYYFAFYVIGKYVDPAYRFDGLVSAARWLLGRGR